MSYLCTEENKNCGGFRTGIAVCGDHYSRLYTWTIREEADVARTCDDLMGAHPLKMQPCIDGLLIKIEDEIGCPCIMVQE